MTFSIRSIGTGDSQRALCELVLGDHKEVFPLITSMWTRDMYQAQWMDALRALVEDRVSSCVLVTDIKAPEISYGVSYWALFKEDGIVYFQERFSRNLMAELISPASTAEPHIPARVQGTPEEHSQVSEWELSIDEVRHFIEEGN